MTIGSGPKEECERPYHAPLDSIFHGLVFNDALDRRGAPRENRTHRERIISAPPPTRWTQVPFVRAAGVEPALTAHKAG